MLCLFEEATPWKIWFQRGQIVQQALVAKVLVSLYHIVLATFDNFELLEGSQKEINHYELDNLKCFMKTIRSYLRENQRFQRSTQSREVESGEEVRGSLLS